MIASPLKFTTPLGQVVPTYQDPTPEELSQFVEYGVAIYSKADENSYLYDVFKRDDGRFERVIIDDTGERDDETLGVYDTVDEAVGEINGRIFCPDADY